MLLITIFAIVAISACVQNTNPFQKEFAGQIIKFRGDLNEADKVPVYPNETALKDSFLGPDVKRIKNSLCCKRY